MAALSAYLVDSGESALPPLVQSLFHGLFHEWMCLVIRGAPWNVELGRVTGEESERFFSMLGKLDNALSQSARGRRCYVLHSFVAYYNTNKAMAMHTFLQTRFDRIICELNQHLDELQQADPMSLELYKSDIVKLQVSQALIANACMHVLTARLSHRTGLRKAAGIFSSPLAREVNQDLRRTLRGATTVPCSEVAW